MRKSLYVLALAAGLCISAQAESWTGKLIDATCNEQQQHEKTVSCDATRATTVFALDVTGKIFKLDVAGNAKAVTALKYRAEPRPEPSDPATPPKSESPEVKATVTGTEAGGMLLVETIDLQ